MSRQLIIIQTKKNKLKLLTPLHFNLRILHQFLRRRIFGNGAILPKARKAIPQSGIVAKTSAGARTQPSGYERLNNYKLIDTYGGSASSHRYATTHFQAAYLG
jgi:hypothetical protein